MQRSKRRMSIRSTSQPLSCPNERMQREVCSFPSPMTFEPRHVITKVAPGGQPPVETCHRAHPHCTVVVPTARQDGQSSATR